MKYIPQAKNVDFITVTLRDEESELNKKFSFWNDGQNYLLETTHYKKSIRAIFRDLIIYNNLRTNLENDTEETEVIRFMAGKENVLFPVSHAIFIDKINGYTY